MAEELTFISGGKKEQYLSLLSQVKALMEGEEDLVTNLANVTAVLKEVFDFSQVGSYLVKQGRLMLGPFQGPVVCARIRKGKGICGTAWEGAKIQLVLDMGAFPGRIARSSFSRLGIVAPLTEEGRAWGVLDIDSDLLNFSNETDRKYLEEMCRYL